MRSADRQNFKPSREVWPGCGDGRHRLCGAVYDFGRQTADGSFRHEYRCREYQTRGCPKPLPNPNESVADWKQRKGRT